VILLLVALAAAQQAMVLEAPPFTIHAPASLSAEAESLAAILPATLDRIGRTLDAPALPAARLYLVPERGSGGLLPPEAAAVMPDWAAGIALVETRTAVIRIDRIGPYGQRRLENVFVHELTHLVMAEAAGDGRGAMPRWFREGVAGHVARDGEWLDFVHLWLSPVASSPHPLGVIESAFDRADNPGLRRAAYAGSFLFVGHVAAEHGEVSLAAVLRGLREGRDFDQAWALATGGSLHDLETAWAGGMRGSRRWIGIVTSTATLWALVTALFLLAGAARRARTRRTMKEWEKTEPPDIPGFEGDPH